MKGGGVWRGHILLAASLALASLRCAGDPAGPGGSALDLIVDWGGLGARGLAEEVHLEIRDAKGDLWVEPQVATVAPDGAIAFDLVLSEGAGLEVALWVDAEDGEGRGITAEGRTPNVTVRSARTTEVTVRLVGTVPTLAPVVAEPGDLSYALAWSSVPGSLRYDVLEIGPAGRTILASADTALTLPIAAARARAGGDETDLVYRVRAVLPRGAGAYGDPVSFGIEAVRDLPAVLTVLPADGTAAVRDTTAPRLVFDREMDWATLSLAEVRLQDEGSGEVVLLTPRGAGATLTLDHPTPLRRGRNYRLELTGALADAEGRPFDQEPTVIGLQGFTSVFTTEVYDPVTVSSVLPPEAAVDVAIATGVQVVLSREVLAASVNTASVLLEDATGTAVAASVSFDAPTRTVRLQPTAPLAYDATYTVRVTPLVLDLRGEPLDQDPSTEIPVYEEFSSSFRTLVQPVGPRVIATVPPDAAAIHPPREPIVATFDRALEVASVNPTTSFRIVKLPIGAAVPGQISADAGRAAFTFTPTTPLEAGLHYRIELTTALRDEAGVPLDQDPGTPGFQGFTAEFRVEDVFGLLSVVPADGAERVPRDAVVVLSFPRALDAATLDGAELLRGLLPLPANRSLSANGRVLTLMPEEPLATFTSYEVRVDGDLRTTEGDHFDEDPGFPGYQTFASRFTTRPDSIPPRVAAVIPADGAEGVAPDARLEITFTKPIRPGSVNAETVLLQRVGGGSVTGVFSVSADSLRAFFSPAAALQFLHEYELSVLTWIVDPFDVRLDQDPVAPDRQEFRARFRVDRERQAPRVLAVSPSDGEEGVGVGTLVELLFDEAMDPATLPTALALLGPEGTPQPGTVLVAADSVRVSFVPTGLLLEDRIYEVELGTGATDRWGNALDQDPTTEGAQPFTSSFRTERDGRGPIVVSSDPTDGESGVEPDVSLELLFDEELDDATVSASGIILRSGDGEEVALASLDQVAPGRVVLAPATPLATDTDYVLLATPELTDTLGNVFDQDPGTSTPDEFRAHFRTRPENVPPAVVAVLFESDPPVPATNPRIVCSEPIDPASLDPGDIVLRPGRGADLAITVEFLSADTLVVRPEEPLESLASYDLVVEGLTDLVGNPFDQDPATEELDAYLLTFETAPDTGRPRVVAVEPVEGAAGLRPEATVTLTFSEAMRTEDFDDFTYQLVRLEGSTEFPVDGVISWNPEQTRFVFTPIGLLLLGARYEVRADYRLRDLAGNPLDQDPETPEEDVFVSRFLVGAYPEPELGISLCADSTWVVFDAQASFDPDGSLDSLVFIWGDGTETGIADPTGEDFVQGHAYPCLDFAGCDHLDNDGDGAIDGDDCDESYRVILRTRDDDGLWGADSSGVSFCAFGVLASDPPDGAVGVDTLLAEIRLSLSREPDLDSVVPAAFVLHSAGLLEVPIDSVGFEAATNEVVLRLGETLRAGTLHTLEVLSTVVDPDGRGLDQDPCAPGTDPFLATFTTESPPLPGVPTPRESLPASAGPEPSPGGGRSGGGASGVSGPRSRP